MVWAASLGAAAVMLVAGCGTTHYRPAADGRGGGTGNRSDRAAVLGPTTITKADAERLAQTLLARAVVPRGAHVRSGPAPAVIRQPPDWIAGSPSLVLHRIWTVRQPMSAVYDLLNRSVPAGMRSAGNSQAGGSGEVTQEAVFYNPSRLPTGVEQATLTMSVAPSGAVSLLRADVQVIWYPPRSAAEHIPASMRVVTITATYVGPGQPRTVSKTFTSAALTGRLAAMLNGTYASIGGVMSCPLERVTYKLTFATSRTATPYVAGEEGCGTVSITVGGRPQPALQTPPALDPALSKLMSRPSDLPRSARIPPGQ